MKFADAAVASLLRAAVAARMPAESKLTREGKLMFRTRNAEHALFERAAASCGAPLERTRHLLFAAALALAFAPVHGQSTPDKMILIPAGPFTMGSNEGPQDERPAHEVTLRAYELDRFPVTNAQFADFLNATANAIEVKPRLYDFDDPDARVHMRSERFVVDAGFENHPAVEVPWRAALAYCTWRGKRLPTEAEWEKAARGTDARHYPWGQATPERRHANYGTKYGGTTAVDTHPAGASPYGIREMAGNVWQWVSSAYRPYPYRADDGRENLDPGPVRSTRGGGHDSPAADITTSQRGRNLSRNPTAGHHNIGFRCARNG
jgi:formylglycine-generating enzyme required for sulfatase activity